MRFILKDRSFIF